PKITNSEGSDGASDEASPEGPSTILLDVYLGDGLLRQVSLDLGEESGKVTVKYFDWGKPSAVKAPPKNQIEKSPGAKN
uniref:hypothetical protein n=1 Tax=Nocardioides sp. R-C-SC26 TaxID=2870414 RepID=UPI001E54A32B